MSRLGSRLDGQAALIRRLEAIQNARPLLEEIQVRTIAEAKERVARATGYTARSILPGDLTNKYTIVTVGGAGVFLEFGTRPHIIRPKYKKVLAWGASAGDRRLSGRPRTGGAMRFASYVNHPGTKAQPFLVPGAKAALESVGIRPIIKAWNSAA